MLRGLISLVLVTGCGQVMPPPVVPDAGSWFDDELSRCRIGGEPPHTVDDVIARINALPMPVTVPCFTASLPRPFSIVATTSRFSAQPAGGPEDPRIFIFTAGSLLSVVTDGQGKNLLEVGELVTTSRTLKAEIAFPVTAPITRDAAYAHLNYVPTVTSCGLCHSGEEAHPAHQYARVSIAFRPPARTLISLERVRGFAAACDQSTQRDRCLAFAGVLGFGEVVEGSFPSSFGDFIK